MSLVQGPDEYQYAGFISYRHLEDDTRWAQWLVNALETYRTPERLVRKDYPAAIGRIFRDDDELKAEPELTPAIRAALWASKYLLVVCSPETPRSPWVRAEIALFHHWGRGGRVIPILISGNPALSFPPELIRTEVVGEGPDAEFRAVEPRGADVAPKQGISEAEQREAALLTIAATVLGCAFGELKDRHEERERRITSHAYFHDLVWRRGAPEGVLELSEADVARRSTSFRVETRGGLVTRVRVENSRGLLREADGEICQWDVAYREDGSVELVEERNRHGVVRRKLRYNRAATIVDIAYDDDSAAPLAGIVSGSGYPDALRAAAQSRRTMILRQLIDYDQAGFVLRRRHCRDAFNTPVSDAAGNFGEATLRNSLGQELERRVLDAQGEPMVQTNGVASTRMTYDGEGRMLSWWYADEAGAPMLASSGFCRVERTYDALGNVCRMEVFDAGGLPTHCAEGYSTRADTFDAVGDNVETSYFGPDGRPVMLRDGYSSWRRRFDSRGNEIESAWFNTEGSPVYVRRGFAVERYVLDNRNNLTRLERLGSSGELVVGEGGYAAIERTVDANGNVTGLTAFGPDGRLCTTTEGWAQCSARFDAYGNEIERSYRDDQGRLTISKRGAAIVRQAFDTRGNIVQVKLFGADGEPANGHDGWHEAVTEVDASGNPSEVRYFGATGEPVCESNHVHKARFTRDSRGAVIREDYFDEQGRPTVHRSGHASLLWDWSLAGNVIRQSFLGPDGALVACRKGFAVETHEWDCRGNILRTDYFDPAGAPVMSEDGYASVITDYDRRGLLVGQNYLDVSGRPTPCRLGFARLTQHFDARGNLIGSDFFDAAGELTLQSNGSAATRVVRDAQNRPVEVQFLGVDRLPTLSSVLGCSMIRARYDERGNQIEFSCFGVDGDPCLNAYGYAREVMTYDGRNRLLRKVFLGVDEEPAAAWAAREGPDDMIEPFEGWRDVVLKAVLPDEHWTCSVASIDQEFDEPGRVVRRRFFGVDGRPTDGPEGFAEIGVEFDAFGRPVRIECRPAVAEPLVLRPVFLRKAVLDRLAVETLDGSPAMTANGVSAVTLRYDGQFNRIEARFLSPDGSVVMPDAKDGSEAVPP